MGRGNEGDVINAGVPGRDNVSFHRALEVFQSARGRGERVFLTDERDEDRVGILEKIAEEQQLPFVEINLSDINSDPGFDYEGLDFFTAGATMPKNPKGMKAKLELLRQSLGKPSIVYINNRDVGEGRTSLGVAMSHQLGAQLTALNYDPNSENTVDISDGDLIGIDDDCVVVVGFDPDRGETPSPLLDRVTFV